MWPVFRTPVGSEGLVTWPLYAFASVISIGVPFAYANIARPYWIGSSFTFYILIGLQLSVPALPFAVQFARFTLRRGWAGWASAILGGAGFGSFSIVVPFFLIAAFLGDDPLSEFDWTSTLSMSMSAAMVGAFHGILFWFALRVCRPAAFVRRPENTDENRAA